MYSDMARYRSSYRLSCNRSVGSRTDFRNGKIGMRIKDDLLADDGILSSPMSSNEENSVTPKDFCCSKIILLGWHNVVAVGSPRGSVMGGTTNAKEDDNKILHTMRMVKQYARIVVATSY